MKLKRITLILTTLLLAVSFMTAQETKAKPIIVVIPFEAKNVEQDDADVLHEIFTNELVGTGKFKIVDRSKVNEIKKQHEFQNSDWSNNEKVAKLGNALNANMVVVGKIMPFQKKITSSFRILDVNTMEIVSSATERVSDISEFFDKIPNVVRKLTGEINNTPETESISTYTEVSTNKTENISMSTDVSVPETQPEESSREETSNVYENNSQDIDFSISTEQTSSEKFSKEELKNANDRYWNNMTGGALLLTFGLMSSVTGLILAIVGFVQYDYYHDQTPSLDDYKDYYGRYDYDSYYDDCDYYSDNANGYLAMGILGVVPLLTGGLLMTFLSAIPFSSASAINKKYFTVSGTGGYGNKNERLEIAFGYRF